METLTPTMTLIPEYGDLMPFEEFKECCEGGCFTDYDGAGYHATDSGYARSVLAWPSKVKEENHQPPSWATHVMWFNH